MKVILNVIAGVCVGIAAASIGLIYLYRVMGVPTDPTPFKIFLENYGLNLLGDSLAGIMALVTLLVVIASLAFQMEAAKQTVKDMKAQNDLNAQIADANYKLALHEKRLAVYLKLKECFFDSLKTNKITPAIRVEILSAIEDAKFLFNKDVFGYVDNMGNKAVGLAIEDEKEARLKQEKGGTPLDSEQTKEWRKVLDKKRQIEESLKAELTPENLRKHFHPYLELPESIAKALYKDT